MKRVLNLLTGIAAVFTAFGIAAGVFLAFVNVVARYIFESSFTWAGELTIYLFLWSIFFGAAYCFKTDAHISVDVFLQKASPKFAKLLRLLTLFITTLYIGAIAYYGYKYVLLYIDLGEVSIDLDIPLWIPYVVIPISFGISTVILFDKIITIIKTPAQKLKNKSEAELILEEMGAEELLKEAERKTGGML
jgi:C4-dicarboxylate transporter DctQ subunit